MCRYISVSVINVAPCLIEDSHLGCRVNIKLIIYHTLGDVTTRSSSLTPADGEPEKSVEDAKLWVITATTNGSAKRQLMKPAWLHDRERASTPAAAAAAAGSNIHKYSLIG